MQLSVNTIEILRDFSRIQQGLFIEPGNLIKARSEALYAEARVAETFPTEFGIRHLRDFLRTIALFKEAVLDITPESVLITEADGTAELRYACAKPGSLPRPSQRRHDFVPPSEVIRFTINAHQWSCVQKALGNSIVRKADDLGMRFMRIVSNGTTVRLGTQSYAGQCSTGYSVTVKAETYGRECNMLFRRENVPTMAGAYEVTVTSLYTEFTHTSGYNVLYLFAPEPFFSSFGGKQKYRVSVTQSMVQECVTFVEAHSPEEAKALVEQRSDEEFQWTAEPRPQRECTVVLGASHDLLQSSLNSERSSV